eukprot:7824161-Pyramimonas_sp.AAC.1
MGRRSFARLCPRGSQASLRERGSAAAVQGPAWAPADAALAGRPCGHMRRFRRLRRGAPDREDHGRDGRVHPREEPPRYPKGLASSAMPRAVRERE